MKSETHSFRDFFRQATGLQQGPYPYQKRLAFERVESRLIHVPTGAGKSAAAMQAGDGPGARAVPLSGEARR
jgi:hypothetical protein